MFLRGISMVCGLSRAKIEAGIDAVSSKYCSFKRHVITRTDLISFNRMNFPAIYSSGRLELTQLNHAIISD